MIKREIVETTYEYDSEGKLIRKTVTETKEDDSNYYSYPNYWYSMNSLNPIPVSYDNNGRIKTNDGNSVNSTTLNVTV